MIERTLVEPNLPRPRAVRYPALARWRRELAAGERTITTFDPLWRAACAEAEQLEAGRPA